eukprot:COSAG05_NODE_436_length_9838_cov_49.389876_13_plen_363_part_00
MSIARRKSIVQSAATTTSDERRQAYSGAAPDNAYSDPDGVAMPESLMLLRQSSPSSLPARTRGGYSAPPARSGKELWETLRECVHDPLNLGAYKLHLAPHKVQWRREKEKQEHQDPDQGTLHTDLERQAVEQTCCLRMPDAGWINYWVVTQCLLLLYISAVVPFRLGFDIDAEPWEFFFVFDIFVDVYFIIDMVFNFTTCIIDEDGNLTSDRLGIAKAYFKSWFLIDFVSVAPVHYIEYLPGIQSGGSTEGAGMGGGGADTGGSNKIIRLLRLAKLLKLLRVAKISRIVEKCARTHTLSPLRKRIQTHRCLGAQFPKTEVGMCYTVFPGTKRSCSTSPQGSAWSRLSSSWASPDTGSPASGT